jgi:hypothetical protein
VVGLEQCLCRHWGDHIQVYVPIVISELFSRYIKAALNHVLSHNLTIQINFFHISIPSEQRHPRSRNNYPKCVSQPSLLSSLFQSPLFPIKAPTPPRSTTGGYPYASDALKGQRVPAKSKLINCRWRIMSKSDWRRICGWTTLVMGMSFHHSAQAVVSSTSLTCMLRM